MEVSQSGSIYREIIIESFIPQSTSGHRVPVLLRPIQGQFYPSTMLVEASRAMRNPAKYPIGTRFVVNVCEKQKAGGRPHLYCNHRDPVIVSNAFDRERVDSTDRDGLPSPQVEHEPAEGTNIEEESKHANVFLRIRWWQTTEFLSLPLPESGSLVATTASLETWHDSGDEKIEYKLKCSVTAHGQGRYTAVVQYLERLNSNLAEKEVAWGESTISLDLQKMTVKAKYQAIPEHEDWTGPAKNARILDQRILSSSKAYEYVMRIARNRQTQLRQDLLDLYGRCVISGERIPELLDAAHILDHAKDGAPTTANSLLLRTDLHRLFDRGYLRIDTEGRIRFEAKVKSSYESLNNTRLAAKIVQRVQKALEVAEHRRVQS